jgi:hypothetical protein
MPRCELPSNVGDSKFHAICVGFHEINLRDRAFPVCINSCGVNARNHGGLLVSGQVWGEAGLVGRPAILDLPVGKGHVVSFNFNPMHRYMNRGDHRMLWNAILNWEKILAK